MHNAKLWVFSGLLVTVLWGSVLFVGTSPSQAQVGSKAEHRAEQSYWRHHDGHWSHWERATGGGITRTEATGSTMRIAVGCPTDLTGLSDAKGSSEANISLPARALPSRFRLIRFTCRSEDRPR